MIASGLIFLLGFCVASFLALLVAPLVVRRARRLARREFDASIPVSPNEIRASFDLVRAEAALISRRREMEAREMREKAALERAEAGRVSRENADLRMKTRNVGTLLETRDATIADLETRLAERGREIEQLTRRSDELEAALVQRLDELDEVTLENRDLSTLAEDRRARMAGLELAVKSLRDELAALGRDVPVEEDAPAPARPARAPRAIAVPTAAPTILDGPAALVAEEAAEAAAPDRPAPPADPAAELNRQLGYAAGVDPLDPAQDDASLRESVSDLAARLLAMTSRTEGAGSEIERLLAAPEPAGHAERPTLAERVRRLRATEAQPGAAQSSREG